MAFSKLQSVAGTAMAAIATAAMTAMPAQAVQRDPAYASARANGAIGEKIDGYLGIVGSPDPSLRKLVDDEIEVTVPSGDKFYLVEKIEFI